ncbi:mucin-13b [Phyllopteryx taeniolatus]|uniref:mucin-13b n=1 Tax=Phyllopteryx taeniolatus TaxID=161469 RepID=UPI002AD368E3|nr:mucin-13b [Phyllopteryx taeniolatus]
MAPEFKLVFVLCLFALSELVVPNSANPASPPRPTTSGPLSTTKLTTSAPVSTTNPPKPTRSGPASTTTPPKPTTSRPASTTTPPKPSTSRPASTTTPPKPSTSGPASTTTPPKPSTSRPASTTTPPKPTTSGPASTTTPPKPTTSGPASTTTPPKPTTPGQVNTTNSTDSASPPTEPVTTETPDICELQPCPDRSECEPRANNTRVCVCMAGDYYNEESQRCELAKVFPGQLQVPGIPFEDDMKIKTSLAFQRAAEQISEQIGLLFSESSGYSRSIVLELKSIGNPKVRATPGVNAAVEMVFETSAEVKTQQIVHIIGNASKCDKCLLANSSFANTDLCIKQPCDGKTTKCTAGDSGDFLCDCLKGYIMTDYSQRMCVACLSGLTPNGTWECVACPFGYSGFNCGESWKLVLVIVGSVLGGLLLITLIILIVMSVKSPKKTKKNKGLNSKNHDVSRFSDKDPLVMSLPTNQRDPPIKPDPTMGVKPFPSGGMPRIPRATTSSAWDNGTNLEMTASNSRQNLVAGGRSSWLNDNSEEMNGSPYTRPRNQTNPYGQTRPLNNPYTESRAVNNSYAQDRPQINPYARNQGQNNPNYSDDDGRPFNY